MVYLITHGEKVRGADPLHTQEGIKKISDIEIPENLSMVVAGTGKRMLEVLSRLGMDLPINILIKISPFCGSGDSLEDEEWIRLSNGNVYPLDWYDGLGNPAFNAWNWIALHPENTLFIAGGELMTALGLADINEKGHLYELDPKANTGKMIQ